MRGTEERATDWGHRKPKEMHFWVWIVFSAWGCKWVWVHWSVSKDSVHVLFFVLLCFVLAIGSQVSGTYFRSLIRQDFFLALFNLLGSKGKNSLFSFAGAPVSWILPSFLRAVCLFQALLFKYVIIFHILQDFLFTCYCLLVTIWKSNCQPSPSHCPTGSILEFHISHVGSRLSLY